MSWGLPGIAALVFFVGSCLIYGLSNPNNRVQNWIQFAIIFMVVTMLVIAVLIILGPMPGGPFSTINKSLAQV